MEAFCRKKYFAEAISLLYVALFVYAASSKFMDFENFQVQLGQSPLLSAFAGYISWLVPLAEFAICTLLLLPHTRFVGLFASYTLMVMFTAYIIIVLHFTSFVPCSCGGILEELGWTEHLIFNFIFIILAVAAILCYPSTEIKSRLFNPKRSVAICFSFASLFSIALVAILFLLSENIIHYHNRLTRRFPHTPAKQSEQLDLKVNSYYIAGVSKGSVYLGNTTAPLLITVIDNKLNITAKKLITLDDKNLAFRAVRIAVEAPYFYVVDGTVPCIYKGTISDWKATLIKKDGEYFAAAVPLDSVSLAIRSHSSKTGESILGVVNTATGKTILNPKLLQKQFDGVFDNDGHLLHSKGMGRIIYLYAYRNQFTLADQRLTLDYRGNTIDTISRAQLKVVKVESHHHRKIAEPPLFVNKSGAAYNNLLFVNSAIPGKYEDERLWERTSIIDVYDLSDNSYVYSFTINDIKGRKVRNFVVFENDLYALVGNHLFHSVLDRKKMDRYENKAENQLQSIGQIAGRRSKT